VNRGEAYPTGLPQHAVIRSGIEHYFPASTLSNWSFSTTARLVAKVVVMWLLLSR
jgi:hypothetical protein